MIQAAAKRPLNLVTVNAGSSSLRIAGYRLECRSSRTGHVRLSPAPAGNPGVLSDFVLSHNLPQPDIVMHRVVHGGSRLRAPCLIDEEVKAEIKRLQTLAPLHNGIALDWIETAREAFGQGVLQGACFDTGYYANLPPAAATYALPREMSVDGPRSTAGVALRPLSQTEHMTVPQFHQLVNDGPGSGQHVGYVAYPHRFERRGKNAGTVLKVVSPGFLRKQKTGYKAFAIPLADGAH